MTHSPTPELVTYYHAVLLRRRPRHLLPRRSLTPKASSPITTAFSYAEGLVTYYHSVLLRRRRRHYYHGVLLRRRRRHLLPRRSLTPKASSPIPTAFSYAEGLVTYYHGVLLRRRPRHLLPRRSLTPKASSPITTAFSYAEGLVTYYHGVLLRRRRSLIKAQGCRNPGG